jgi:hypothetical protein
MTSSQSSHVRDKLNNLELILNIDFLLTDIREQENSHDMPNKKDFLLRDISQQENGHGGSNKKDYMLTPYAFKLALMRARRYSGQTIDPTIYAKYYILLETIFKSYTDYEKLYQAKLLSLKDGIIGEQTDKIDKLTEDIGDLKIEIAGLMMYAKDSNNNISILRDDLTETKEYGKMAVSYLREKCVVSTKNPANPNLHHYFAATQYMDGNVKILKFTTGQKSYVKNTINRLVNKENHTIAIKPFYNANGIDLRNNAYDEFCKYRLSIAKIYNEHTRSIDKDYNNKLIINYKKATRSGFRPSRTLSQLKRPLISLFQIDYIPIEFAKLEVKYTQNDYIQFGTILSIVHKLVYETQDSPL